MKLHKNLKWLPIVDISYDLFLLLHISAPRLTAFASEMAGYIDWLLHLIDHPPAWIRVMSELLARSMLQAYKCQIIVVQNGTPFQFSLLHRSPLVTGNEYFVSNSIIQYNVPCSLGAPTNVVCYQVLLTDCSLNWLCSWQWYIRIVAVITTSSSPKSRISCFCHRGLTIGPLLHYTLIHFNLPHVISYLPCFPRALIPCPMLPFLFICK